VPNPVAVGRADLAFYGIHCIRGECRTMQEILNQLAEHFGWAVPFGYAVLAYGFFHWLDENASNEAKAMLARTMRLKDYKKEQVASALVEVFDRIYTYPLLRWRAFFRSLLFTTGVSTIYMLEAGHREYDFMTLWLPALLFNVLTDYLSLFVIRPLLVRSGAKPVIGLTLGTVSGAVIVLGADILRRTVFLAAWFVIDPSSIERLARVLHTPPTFASIFAASLQLVPRWGFSIYAWPALLVFAWLPLFALGILTARLLTPLSWVVERTQWFLKEGKEHPLKAIGYVAAVVVFVAAVAWRAVFGA
jgi:hypothetical protein